MHVIEPSKLVVPAAQGSQSRRSFVPIVPARHDLKSHFSSSPIVALPVALPVGLQLLLQSLQYVQYVEILILMASLFCLFLF